MNIPEVGSRSSKFATPGLVSGSADAVVSRLYIPLVSHRPSNSRVQISISRLSVQSPYMLSDLLFIYRVLALRRAYYYKQNPKRQTQCRNTI